MIKEQTKGTIEWPDHFYRNMSARGLDGSNYITYMDEP
jgi:hypothetical protein